MKDCDPKTLEDYNRTCKMNQEITGAGIDTVAIFSCPGCASKGWAEFRIATMHLVKESKPTKCKVCERTFFFRITKVMGATSITLCQSGGDDVPEYLPLMHRV